MIAKNKSKMWDRDKIEYKRNYFKAQRQNATGNFTEFVVRTYYFIYKLCSDYNSDFCYAYKLCNRDVAKAVYDGIYDKPDHDYQNVISSCKDTMAKMGYIHFDTLESKDIIVIDRALDFLQPGEHEDYIKRFAIRGMVPFGKHAPTETTTYRSKPEEQSLSDALDGVLYPENYPYPTQKKPEKKSIDTGVACEMCDGHYMMRSGKYGTFFGCSNFPKCRSTKSITDFTYELLVKNGINIYEIQHSCWKCKKVISIRSYFPKIDLMKVEKALEGIENLEIIRLSVLDSLDTLLEQKYTTICIKESKRAGFAYMANTCPHCGSLQGSQLALGEMYEQLLQMDKGLAENTCIIETIAVNEKTLPKQEWDDVLKKITEL